MGNSKGKQKPPEAQASVKSGKSGNAEVKRRETPNRGSRPLSDPGVSTDVYPGPNPNVYLRPKDDVDLSGRRYGQQPTRGPSFHGDRGLARHHSERIRTDYSQMPEPKADYFVTEAPLASMLMDNNPPALDAYHRAVNQLVVERPEYEPLKTLDFSVLSNPVLDVLGAAFRRLYDQQDAVKRLEKERADLDQQVRRLEDDRRVLHKENGRVSQDNQLLRDELRRRGGEERERLMSGSADSDSQEPTPRSLGAEDERPLGKKGIYMPTPLLQAERDTDKTRNAVTRKESLRPHGGQRAAQRGQSESSDPDLVRKLQSENADLQDKLKMLEREVNPYSTLPRRSIKPEQLSEKYRQLEEDALGKVASTVSHHLSHVNEHRQRQFLCSIMQTAFDISSKTVKQFRETVQGLLLNPVKTDTTPQPNGVPVGKPANKAVINQAKKQFEAPEEPKNVSKLAMRTLEVSKVPETLSNQIDDYLVNMSASINISSLVESVVDALTAQFSECTTPAVLNQSVFNHYIHDCCRLAWQMCVIIPAVHVTVEDNYRFDDRRHRAFKDEKVVTNAKINYYVWPELLSKKGGDVLHKGMVCLKT